MRKLILHGMIAFSSLLTSVHATTADSLQTTIIADYCGLWQINSHLYEGPVATALRPGGSISNVSTAGAYQKGILQNQGWAEGETRSLTAQASTRTRILGGITTGSAAYSNTIVDHLSGCETLEAPILYPYLTTDTVGGSLNAEAYRFAGSYSCSHGNLSVGIGAQYRAALEYRQIDPRPRNITGDLNVTLGSLHAVSSTLGCGLEFRLGRYRHSSQITFVNPLGGAVIHHKTGPDSHYARFAGNGLSTYYTGQNYGIALSMLPLKDDIGWTAGISADYGTLTKQLVDLNRLPLTRKIVELYTATLSWTARRGGWKLMPYAQWKHNRIHGHENIFGDATAGVYPMISSLEMYGFTNSSFISGVAALWASKHDHSIMFDLGVGQYYSQETYRQPAYNTTIHNHDWHCRVKACGKASRGLVTADIGCGREYTRHYSHVAIGTCLPLTPALMLNVSVNYQKMQSTNNILASMGVIF